MKIIYLFFICATMSAQTYTSILDGNWSDSSTWESGIIPPFSLENDSVYINTSVTILDGNLTIKASSFVDISGSLTLDNGDFSNLKGDVILNDGRITLTSGTYKNDSDPPNGTKGSGYITATDGNIKNKLISSVFSSDIKWCIVTGNDFNLPTTEDCSILSSNDHKIPSFSIYPNPSYNELTIKLPQDIIRITIKIYNFLGKCIFEKENLSTKNGVVLRDLKLNKGVYIVEVNDNDSRRVSREKLIIL